MRREAGFTLLEILVALTVLGFLMAALAGGVQFGLKSWDLQDRFIDDRGDLDSIDRLLRQLIGRMDPGSDIVAPTIFGTRTSFDFTTDLPDGAASAETRHADVRLTVDAGHRLLLRWTPHMHARASGPPPPPHSVVLLSGVDHLDLSYWRAPAGWVGEWRTREPPELVRIGIAFIAGDARHWPLIVAAPMRERAK